MDGDLGAVTPQSLDDAYQPPIYFPPVQRSPARTKLAEEPSQSKKRRSLTRSTAFPEAAMDTYTLTKLQRWIVCFAVVEFNLDTGVSLAPPPRVPLFEPDHERTRYSPTWTTFIHQLTSQLLLNLTSPSRHCPRVNCRPLELMRTPGEYHHVRRRRRSSSKKASSCRTHYRKEVMGGSTVSSGSLRRRSVVRAVEIAKSR